MATVTELSCVDQIGQVAGTVWHCLDEHGSMSLAKLTRTVEAPRDTVMQAVGWLARESKITIEETSRGRVVALKTW